MRGMSLDDVQSDCDIIVITMILFPGTGMLTCVPPFLSQTLVAHTLKNYIKVAIIIFHNFTFFIFLDFTITILLFTIIIFLNFTITIINFLVKITIIIFLDFTIFIFLDFTIIIITMYI